MSSNLAKKAAGIYVEDVLDTLPTVLAWTTEECRTGKLQPHVKQFCEAQPELLDLSLVLAEQITDNCIHCRIPVKAFDHESNSTFNLDVLFHLNPKTGICQRV